MVRHGMMREETVLRCQGNVRRHNRVVAGDCCTDFEVLYVAWILAWIQLFILLICGELGYSLGYSFLYH